MAAGRHPPVERQPPLLGLIMNLLKETIEAIEGSGHTPDQIRFIGSRTSGHRCTWERFTALADREYDNGFGSPKVAGDLEIVFTDGASMHRGEYDGSEWWVYSKPFYEPETSYPIKTLFGDGWRDLEGLNPPPVDRADSTEQGETK